MAVRYGGSCRFIPGGVKRSCLFRELDNNVYAIDAVTGTEKWRFVTGGLCGFIPGGVKRSRLYREL